MFSSRREFLRALTVAVVAAAAGSAVAGTRDLTIVAPEKPAKPASSSSAPMMVSLLPEGSTTLAIGSPYRFSVSASRSGYGHVYVASASGKVQLWAENIRLKAGVPVPMPRSNLKIVASAPAGDDTIYFVATRDRFSGFFGGKTIVKPADIQVTQDELLAQISAKLAKTPRKNWAYTTQVIRVVD